MTQFKLKRIYDEPAADDGYRVLVDRLWPRGVSKQHADLTEWCKDVAPSDELRSWYGHRPELFEEFTRRYRAELADSGAATELADRLNAEPTVTLLIGARDAEHSQGRVLLDVLTGR